ncbi:MAG: lytic transglycosylase domain-containing protein [Rhodobacteraceae bacterium]|nr:lytic transglycosylase domain-containing protein [Paracoccaceae bacterium]
MLTRRTALILTLAGLSGLAACGDRSGSKTQSHAALYPGETPHLRALIVKWAAIHEIPESLLHKQIQRESGYNPAARNGPYYGLMQISLQTARGMGYRGTAAGLLDAETNLEFAGKYLRGAWIVSGGHEDKAMMWYAKGYYYEAKRLGLLKETGLRA